MGGQAEPSKNGLIGFVGRLASAADAPHESLGKHPFQGGRDHEGFHSHVDKSGNGARGVVGVERGEDQVTGQRCLDGDGRRLEVTCFPDHDAVGILTEEGPEYLGECQADAFVDGNLHDAVDLVFHGILGGEELGIDCVDLVEAGVKGRGLS